MRCLFCSMSTPGFLFPLVGLAIELRQRGHEIAFASGLAASAPLANEDFRRIPRTAADGESFRIEKWAEPISTLIDLKHIEYAVDEWRPDVLVTHQLCQAALLARERVGIPAAVMGLFAYLWPTVGTGVRDMRQWRIASSLTYFNRARAVLKLEPIGEDAGSSPFLADAFLLRSVTSLTPELEFLPDIVHLVGGCEWEPEQSVRGDEHEFGAQLSKTETPVLYVHHGQTFGAPTFWDQFVEAVADQDYFAVASIGRMGRTSGPLPPNIVARPHVSQAAVLPYAAATVSGGHSSVVIGSLSHGVPSIAIPTGGEMPDNAARITAFGCGIQLDPGAVTGQVLREALAHVIHGDESLRRNARDFSVAYACVPSFDVAATIVERVGATQMPVKRTATIDVPHLGERLAISVSHPSWHSETLST